MTRLWFRARSYGWRWTPVTVEGWLVMLAFLVAVGIVTAVFLYQVRHGADPGRSTLLFMLGIAILTGLLVAVAWLTGARPRWRWGE